MKSAQAILLLMLALFAAPVLAQSAGGASGKANPGEMSYQEYLVQRAKMLLRMKGANPQQGQQAKKEEGAATAGAARDTTYGQGFSSRKGAGDAAARKPDVERGRPERPERPQIERPGRP